MNINENYRKLMKIRKQINNIVLRRILMNKHIR